MSDFLKNDIFDVFQPNSLKRKLPNQNPPASSQKKLKVDNNPQSLSNPMKKLEETLMDEKLEDSEIEEEKDPDFKDLNEKEKELQKKYMLEKFDIDITTEDFGCVHEIVAPKGYQRKGFLNINVQR